MNALFVEPDDNECPGDEYVKPGKTDIKVQLVISLGLGISAFLCFCVSRLATPDCARGYLTPAALPQVLRPRWKSLYAARKRYSDPPIAAPFLPDSFLGWIPALYKITEEDVLASAGLDAFVVCKAAAGTSGLRDWLAPDS